MRRAVLKTGLICFLTVLVLSCTGVDTKSARSATIIHNLINTPLEFVNETSQKLWEGEIGGKWVTYFKTVDNFIFKDVVVVTKDMLPESYRSMEYCDDNGDSIVDKVNIRMYEQENGWSNVTINSDNKSILNHANVQYNKLIGEINFKRRGYLSVK
jgi:hypothetical protein